MNSRIQELALQAGFENGHQDRNGNSLSGELEKFAELIVGECVGIVEGRGFLHDQAPDAIFARECSSAIKRHFGVK